MEEAMRTPSIWNHTAAVWVSIVIVTSALSGCASMRMDQVAGDLKTALAG